MANKPIKSIKFPGLSDTYTFVQNAAISAMVEQIYEYVGVKYNVQFDAESGRYVSYTGGIAETTQFSKSEPIPVNENDIVIFTATGYLTNVAMIALTDENESYHTVAVRSTDSTERTYTYTCHSDGYIVVSYNNRSSHVLTIKNGFSNEAIGTLLASLKAKTAFIDTVDFNVIADALSPVVSQSGYYVHRNGYIVQSNSFDVYASITLEKGQVLKFNAIGYNGTVAVLSSVENGTYKPIFVPLESTNTDYQYLATDNIDVVICSNRSANVKYSVYSSDVSNNTTRIDLLEKKEKQKDVFCFTSLGVIGDSLASGASNIPLMDGTTGAHDAKEYSWGKYIEKEHGVAVSLYSEGGTSTRSWFTKNACIGVFNSDSPLDCYCIGLGVNDEYSLGESYLGSINDVHVGSESNNADTYYGNYSKIIATIKAKSQYAKIFCLTNPRANTALKEEFNQAVRDICELYDNVYLIDLVGDPFFSSSDFTNYWYGAHSTAIGYKAMAEHLWEVFNTHMRENPSEFMNVQWILYNQ